jgi:hypothetical protein
LHEQLAGPVARARAAQRALSAGALVSVTRVAFDAARVGGYLECTPEPAQSLLRELITGASPRDLLTSGRAPARLLEAVLSDFARRGGILMVETAGGIEDISQTRVPPSAAPNLGAIPQPEPMVAPVAEPSAAVAAVAVPEPEPAPVSQRKPPAIYSQPPDSELASADEGWFSFQIEASAPPPDAAPLSPAAPDPAPAPAPVLPRSEDPLRKTLSSSNAPPPLEDEAKPGASVPVERGHRPEFRTDTLGSAGNEAAAAMAAVAKSEDASKAPRAAEAAPVVAVEPSASPPRPVVKPPRPDSPLAPQVSDDDAFAQALQVDTPLPLGGTLPLVGAPKAVEIAPAPAPAQPVLGQTLPLEGAKKPAAAPAEVKAEGPKRSEVSTRPPAAAARPASSKAPVKNAPAKAAPAPATSTEGAGWVRTALFSLLAAGASYYAITMLSTRLAPSKPAPTADATAPAPVAPAPVVPTPVVQGAPKPQLTTSDSPLPPGTDVPVGDGLLEIQVPDGTAIRVDGEYLGMGPARRVPLAPGGHQLTLGDGAPESVLVKAGQRTLAVLAKPSVAAPAGSL